METFKLIIVKVSDFKLISSWAPLTNENVFSAVTFSYCIDAENRNIGKASNSNRRENSNAPPNAGDGQQQYATTSYQYTLADVPKLAEQAANMYAQNQTEKLSYITYYTDFYTKQISQVSIALQ